MQQSSIKDFQGAIIRNFKCLLINAATRLFRSFIIAMSYLDLYFEQGLDDLNIL